MLFWRQNNNAAKNAKRDGRSSITDDYAISAGHSTSLPSGRRSTQRRCQMSEPTRSPQNWSATQDNIWHVDEQSDVSADSTESLSSDDSDEHVIHGISRRPSDLEDEDEDENHENQHRHDNLTLV